MISDDEATELDGAGGVEAAGAGAWPDEDGGEVGTSLTRVPPERFLSK